MKNVAMTIIGGLLTGAVLLVPIALVHWLWFEVHMGSVALGIVAGLAANGFEEGFNEGRKRCAQANGVVPTDRATQ